MKLPSISIPIQHTVVCLALALAAFAIYGQCAEHKFILFDDGMYVSQNPIVLKGVTWEGLFWAFSNTEAANWHPLTWLSHMVDVELYGTKAGGHVLTNVLLHILCGGLLYGLLVLLAFSRWSAFFIAAIFVVHPANVENVAWVSERKSMLSVAFLFGAIFCYILDVRQRSARLRFWSYVLFSLALMSKALAVTLPVLLLLLDYWPLQRFRFAVPQWIPSQNKGITSSLRTEAGALLQLISSKWMYWILTVAFCVITYVAQDSSKAVHSIDHNTLGHRVTNIIVSYTRYLEMFVSPDNHSLFYPLQWNYGLYTYYTQSAVFFSLVGLAIIVGLKHRFIFVGWFWFILSMIPMIGLVPVGGQGWADRYLYLPMIGLSIVVVLSLEALLSRILLSRSLLRLCQVVCLGWCVILGGLAWRQAQNWQDSFTIFGQTVENAGTERMMSNLALSALGQNQVHTARYWLNRIHVKNEGEDLGSRLSLMALTFLVVGDYDQVIALEIEALAADPNRAQSWHNIGVAYAEKRQYVESYQTLKKAIALGSRDSLPYDNIFSVIRNLRKLGYAAEDLRKPPILSGSAPSVPVKQGEINASESRN